MSNMNWLRTWKPSSLKSRVRLMTFIRRRSQLTTSITCFWPSMKSTMPPLRWSKRNSCAPSSSALIFFRKNSQMATGFGTLYLPSLFPIMEKRFENFPWNRNQPLNAYSWCQKSSNIVRWFVQYRFDIILQSEPFSSLETGRGRVQCRIWMLLPYNAKNAVSVSCEIHHTVRWRRFHFICLYSFRREPLF